jgi:hypothetical protein
VSTGGITAGSIHLNGMDLYNEINNIKNVLSQMKIVFDAISNAISNLKSTLDGIS